MSDFEKTKAWVNKEEELRKTRVEGISSFNLIIASIMIIGLVVFILYLSGSFGDESALEMIQNSENFYDDEYSENGSYVEEVSEIHLADESEVGSEYVEEEDILEV